MARATAVTAANSSASARFRAERSAATREHMQRWADGTESHPGEEEEAR